MFLKFLHALSFALASLAQAATHDISLPDARRSRDIECRVQVPEQGEHLPLIVFSHGFGDDRTAFTAIAQHWAEGGFVVVSPSHLDGVGKSKRPGDPPAEGGTRALLEKAGENIANRVGDITCIIDSLDALTAKVPALKGRIDPSRIGVGGHSLGAYTSMLIGGVTTDMGGVKARNFEDPRVRCIMPISAQGKGQQGLTESSWATLALPMLTITGSQDKGAGGQPPEWRKTVFKLSPPGDKFLVFIEGAGHLSYGGGSDPSRAPITEVVKTTTLAFWKAYLKDDELAKASLTSGAIVKPFGSRTSIEAK